MLLAFLWCSYSCSLISNVSSGFCIVPITGTLNVPITMVLPLVRFFTEEQTTEHIIFYELRTVAVVVLPKLSTCPSVVQSVILGLPSCVLVLIVSSLFADPVYALVVYYCSPC